MLREGGVRWVFYIGGKTASGKMHAVYIGLSEDPLKEVGKLGTKQPFQLELIAAEKGDETLLAQRKKEHFKRRMANGWYVLDLDLLNRLKLLPPQDFAGDQQVKKVCAEFLPSELRELEEGVSITGTVTKTRFIRRAVHFYVRLWKFHSKGFRLQVLRGGRMRIIDNLDDMPDPDDERALL